MTRGVPPHETSPSAQELAAERTLMALERTLMAWIRTALSMLTFGFSVVKFFQFLREERTVTRAVVEGPRTLGIALMTVGLLSLGMATVQYARGHRRLGGGPLYRAPSFLVAVVLLAIQAVALAWSLSGR
jgi:putative membrane protein